MPGSYQIGYNSYRKEKKREVAKSLTEILLLKLALS